MVCDRPKIETLKKEFPSLYMEYQWQAIHNFWVPYS